MSESIDEQTAAQDQRLRDPDTIEAKLEELKADDTKNQVDNATLSQIRALRWVLKESASLRAR